MRRRPHIHAIALHVGRWTIVIGRWSWYASAVLLVLFAAVFTAARFWLPYVAERKTDIEHYLSEKSSYEISIERLETFWDGLHPGLRVYGLRARPPGEDVEPLSFRELHFSLALAPLLRGKIEVSELVILRPQITVELMPDGRVRVSGFPPLKPVPAGAGIDARPWLSRLHHVVIEQGTLHWRDLRSGEERLDLADLNIDLVNRGDRHQLELQAEFPTEICGACSLALDLNGIPVIDSQLSGRAYVRALGVNLEHLPAVIRERLPRDTAGRVDAQAWATLADSTVVGADGYLSVSRLRLPTEGSSPALEINAIGTNFNWRIDGKSWALALRGMNIGLTGPAWSAGELRVDYDGSNTSVQIENLNLDDVVDFLGKLDTGSPAIERLEQLRPGGEMHNVRVDLMGDWGYPDDVKLRAELAGVSVRSVGKWPGVENFSGRLIADRRSGEVVVDTTATRFLIPHVFRSSLDVRRLSGYFAWAKTDTQWQVIGRDVRFTAADLNGNGSFSLSVPLDKKQSPALKLAVDFRDGEVAHASRYYPVNIVKPGLLKWLDRAIVSGRLVSGSVEYDGELRSFPFRDGGGHYSARLKIDDGTLDYLPAWAPVRNGDFDVLFRNQEMFITANNGRIAGMGVEQLAVYAADLSRDSDKIIEISGFVNGPVEQAIRVLRASQQADPNSRWRHWLEPGLRGSGEGRLALTMSFPAKHAADMTMDGIYEMRGAGLAIPLGDLRLRDIRGHFAFNRAGVTRADATANLLGGPMRLSAKGGNNERGEFVTRYDLAGTISAGGVADAFSEGARPFLEGTGSWTGSVLATGNKPVIDIDADLTDFGLGFPAPLAKSRGQALTLKARTDLGEAADNVVTVTAEPYMRGTLVYKWRDQHWAFWGARIGLVDAGSGAPAQPDVHVDIRAPAVDLDRWQDAFSVMAAHGGGDGPPEFVSRISGSFRDAVVFDRDVGRLAADISRAGTRWRGPIYGDSVEGDVDLKFAAPVNTLHLGLAWLTLPRTTVRESSGRSDPRGFPNLTVKSESFRFGEMDLGALELVGEHANHGWQMPVLHFSRPDMEFLASAKWQRIAGRDAANLSATLTSSDVGKTLEAMGSPGQISEGKAKIVSEFNWKGTNGLALEDMSGTLALSVKKGQFLKVKQGAGRLMGMFDLSAIGRYLTLDFTPLFGKGFTFNDFSGNFQIESGDAHTHDMIISGPSADIKVSGRIGLVDEDYDLVVGVNPSFAETLALTTWGLGVPQVGALILLFKNAFNKQIAKGSLIAYTVTGPWADPVVKRIGKMPERPPGGDGRASP